jgi:DNA-binding transcriptional ArsR family regulator
MMYGVMSRELVREQAMIGMLGALSAEARVARFLVALAERFAQMGYSSKLFNLRMTRHEIGSYLGLTLETVSRTLSAFNEIGLISVDQRTIGIKDPEALKTLRRLPPSRTRGRRRAAKAAVPYRPGSCWRPCSTCTTLQYFSTTSRFTQPWARSCTGPFFYRLCNGKTLAFRRAFHNNECKYESFLFRRTR